MTRLSRWMLTLAVTLLAIGVTAQTPAPDIMAIEVAARLQALRADGPMKLQVRFDFALPDGVAPQADWDWAGPPAPADGITLDGVAVTPVADGHLGGGELTIWRDAEDRLRLEGRVMGRAFSVVSLPDQSLMIYEPTGLYSRRANHGAGWARRLAGAFEPIYMQPVYPLLAALLDADLAPTIGDDGAARTGPGGLPSFCRLRPGDARGSLVLSLAPERYARDPMLGMFQSRRGGDSDWLDGGHYYYFDATETPRLTLEVTRLDAPAAEFEGLDLDVRPPAELRFIPSYRDLYTALDPGILRQRATGVAATQAAPPRTIPTDESTQDWKTRYAEHQAFMQTYVLDVWEAQGEKDPAWSHHARAVLAGAKELVTSYQNAPAFEPLVEPAMAIAKSKCADPVVCYYAGYIIDQAPRPETEHMALNLFHRAARALTAETPYHPLTQHYILRRVVNERLRSWHDTFGSYHDAYMRSAHGMLTYPYANASDAREGAQTLADIAMARPRVLARSLIRDFSDNTELDPGALHAVLASAHMGMALYPSRAKNPPTDAQKEEHWKQAEAHALQSLEHRGDLTAPYDVLMRCTWTRHGGGWRDDRDPLVQQFRDYYYRGIAVNVHAKDLHDIYRKWRPRPIAGRRDSAFALLAAWADYERHDRMLGAWYLNIALVSLAVSSHDGLGWTNLAMSQPQWERVQRIIDGKLAAENPYYTPAEWLSLKLYIAHRIDDRATALRTLNQMREQGIAVAHEVLQRVYDKQSPTLVRDVTALGGELGPSLRYARELLQIGLVDEADRVLSALQPYQDQQAEADWIYDYQAAIRAKQRFDAGEWVDLIGQDLAGWELLEGDVRLTAPGQIALDGNKLTRVVHRADFGRRWEITFSPYENQSQYFLNLITNYSDEGTARLLESWELSLDDDRSSWLVMDTSHDWERQQIKGQGFFENPTIRVTCWDDQVSYYIDDRPIIRDYPHDAHGQSRSRIGFAIGGRYSNWKRPRIVQNPRIRRLTEKPGLDLEAVATAEALARAEAAYHGHLDTQTRASRPDLDAIDAMIADLRQRDLKEAQTARVDHLTGLVDMHRQFQAGKAVDLTRHLKDARDWGCGGHPFVDVRQVGDATRFICTGTLQRATLPLRVGDFRLTMRFALQPDLQLGWTFGEQITNVSRGMAPFGLRFYVKKSREIGISCNVASRGMGVKLGKDLLAGDQIEIIVTRIGDTIRVETPYETPVEHAVPQLDWESISFNLNHDGFMDLYELTIEPLKTQKTNEADQAGPTE